MVDGVHTAGDEGASQSQAEEAPTVEAVRTGSGRSAATVTAWRITSSVTSQSDIRV